MVNSSSIVRPIIKSDAPKLAAYAAAHGQHHDGTFIANAFEGLNGRELAYVLEESGEIQGVASLILEGFEKVGKARFRILHVAQPDQESYRILIDALMPRIKHLNSAFAFIPEELTITRQIWEDLGFTIERYAWVLERDITRLIPSSWTGNYSLKPLRRGKDEEIYAEILNESFRHERGRYPKTSHDILALQDRPDFIPGSLEILYDDITPVGILATSTEYENGESIHWIDTLGLKDDYRGRRLGRQLLRAGCERAIERSADKIMLSVQSQNDKAVQLYLSEGFTKQATMVCYAIEPKEYSQKR